MEKSFYIFILKGSADFPYVLLSEKVRTDLKSSELSMSRSTVVFFFNFRLSGFVTH